MPSEPDQTPIEGLLKSYAKKRAEDAGGPAELHPANRRLLQGEVTKLRRDAEAAGGRSWLHSLILFWPRLAAVSAILVMLVTGVWLLLPDSQPPATMLAKNDRTPTAKSVLDEKGGRDFDGDAPVTAPRTDGVANGPTPSPSTTTLKRELSDKTSVRLQAERLLVEQDERLKQIAPRQSGELPGGEAVRMEADRLQRSAANAEASDASKLKALSDAPISAGAGVTTAGTSGNQKAALPMALGRSLPPTPQPVPAPAAPAVATSRLREVVTKPADRAPAPAEQLAFNQDAAVVSTPAPSVSAVAANPTVAASGDLLFFRRLENQTSGAVTERSQELNFRFVPPEREQKARALIAAPAAGALLANFQLQRQGLVVRVMDGDGSIYTGQVLGTGANGEVGRDQAGTPPVPGSGTASRDTQFRVTGIHRATGQQVIFEGTLLADAQSQAGAAATLAKSIAPAPTRQGVPNRPASIAPSASTNVSSARRVVGTVRLNGTNALPLEAVLEIR